MAQHLLGVAPLRRYNPTFVLALTLCMINVALGLEFDMLAQRKCIYEEINANVIVVGDYRAYHKDNEQADQQVELKVEDPHGNSVHDSYAKSSGQFVFTTKLAGEYKACFTALDTHNAISTKVKLDWKTGVAATDWSSVAKKEHLDSLTLELRRLEDSIREVYSEMLLLQQREQEMRDISEITNARVAWYSIASLLICVLSGMWQLWYLRRFFKRKKLM
ncbi:hypothetical protein CEUSTIGMA_g2931.t1 [Chlamydomonas eustigma]|uniref:GOLD domain-containing protein n=1 Tax=Chlamydomonas eustigma TaxID=1157962 RepID=A0A250WXB5_9CHLO|nr:hypothetical protein CEUSTIGMA_g2931.t1 [Chlamydomonas eustigma]|eukprot:GAX75488.1 hypothetical protein CEUSTIGMA_g2931.t1 [Chlamydomonas eustigma]